MSTRTFGEPVKRNEDRRLLTGQALFIDDIELPGMLHVAFLRSQIAHAKIIRIDVSKALQRPGVVAAYVAGDLGDYWQPGPILVPPPPIEGIVFHERTQVPLAKDKVRHVGEPLVIVIAESRYIAEDALDDIDVELEQLPAVVDLEKGLAGGSALVHDDVGSNVSRICGKPRVTMRPPWPPPTISSGAAFSTSTASRLRSKPAASSRNGMRAPTR